MATVQKLPDSVIHLIAAGEVVERPSSVVKELVENSLDAGATQIVIHIESAGRLRIRIHDNGEGMTPADARLALERHATSKLHAFDDFHALTTFGFRGEALPSIAAVSKLTVTTRTPTADTAWKIVTVGGRIQSEEATGNTPGTIIDVQDLFFNTPARYKFLKRDSTERIHIVKTVQDIALAHPNVGFELWSDGEKVLNTPTRTDPAQRLGDIWGASVSQKLIPLQAENGSTSLRGYVNVVEGHHPTKNFQILYVNGRPVQNRSLTHAVYEAYHEWLPVGRHPVFALFLDVAPQAVDVNVHPTKREVRLSDERSLYEMVFSTIRGRFQTTQGEAPAMVTSRFSGDVLPKPFTPRAIAGAMAAQMNLSTGSTENTGWIADEPAAAPVESPMRFLGHFQKLYLIFEREGELILVDQHAAAERVMYERLLKAAKNGSDNSQPLLHAHLWDASPEQVAVLETYEASLKQMGFGFAPFGGKSIALKEIPALFSSVLDAKRFLEVFLETLQEHETAGPTHEQLERIAHAACRAAIKANDFLDPREIQQVMTDLWNCERPMTCPHGRPTHIRIPAAELHKRFQRQ